METVKSVLLNIPGPMWLKIVLASMIPFVEARYAILFFSDFGIPFYQLFIISVLGNMIPVPIIILLFRPLLSYMKKTKIFRKLAAKMEKTALKKAEKVKKYEALGLFIFVALPVPGTGAISGALAAAILDFRLKYAIPIIFAGAIVATSITSGALKLLLTIF